MAFITLEMLHTVAAKHQVFLLGVERYDAIKEIVYRNEQMKNEVFEIAHEEWAAQQLEKLLVDGTLFVPKPSTGLKFYKERCKGLKTVIEKAQLTQFFWTETERGFSINRQ